MIRYFVILFLFSNTLCHYMKPAGSPCEWNGIPGKCVNGYLCLTAIKDIANRNNPPICSFEGKTAIICCTDCETVKDTRLLVRNPVLGNLFKTGKRKAQDKCVDYLHTLDYKCKKGLRPLPPTKKMFDVMSNCTYEGTEVDKGTGFTSGGADAAREEFPHMALLGYGYSVYAASWLCGGSVISERFILTAAHCLSSQIVGPLSFVALGMLKRSDPSHLWDTYKVHKAIRHPSYNPPSRYHDIALLKTETQIVFSSRVLPACLHVDDEEEVIATATGWGALGYEKRTSDVLQYVQLRKYTNKECSERYSQYRHLARGIDTSTQICYGDMENQSVPTDTCQGDSGGPLQILDNRKCMHMILGVTSFGETHCGLSGGASIYTRVKYYVPWIEDIVWP